MRTLRIIEEIDPTDTALEFAAMPPIVRQGTDDLACGGCGTMLAERVTPRDLYIATAALLRNRMPSRLILICTQCRGYNAVPIPPDV
jgi:hypothetical protein